MTQQNESQFDDLTVGIDADGSFSTESIDLFEFSGGEESPIARLKTIILSIDWEINDDILQQLDDELVDLGEIWADDKIKQVYIQGLNKIGKYIYKEKANAHPNSIKLLITFYHNLEKIVSSEDMMSEEEKKNLLLADVKKFDQLKAQIGNTAPTEPASSTAPAVSGAESSASDERLGDLKALVLGLDWEITDQGLQKLQEEVKRLELVFHEDKAKRILLQGIGAVSAYIDKMRSQSNSKSFSLLHSFCDTLETITLTGVSAEQEKKLLLTEVEKFNNFKKEIAGVTSRQASDVQSPPAAAPGTSVEVTKEPVQKGLAATMPADMSADEERVASDVGERLASVFGDVDEPGLVDATDKDVALEGVNIETEADDDSDEDALPFENGAVAPALADVDEESSFSVEKLAGDLAGAKEEDEPVASIEDVDSVLPGVDVESDADDDTDEEALPFEGGEVAPALSGSFDDDVAAAGEENVPSEDLDNRLDSFFDDEVESSLNKWGSDQDEVTEPPTEEDTDLVAALSEDVAGDSDSLEDEPSIDEEDDPIVAALSEEVSSHSESVEEVFSTDEEDEVVADDLGDDESGDLESAEDIFASDEGVDDTEAILSEVASAEIEFTEDQSLSGEEDETIAALSEEAAENLETVEDESPVEESEPETEVEGDTSLALGEEDGVSPIEADVEEQLSIFDEEPSSESDMVAALSPDANDIEADSSIEEIVEEADSDESFEKESLFVDDQETETSLEISDEAEGKDDILVSDAETLVDDEEAEDVSFAEADSDLLTEDTTEVLDVAEKEEPLSFLDEDAGDLVDTDVPSSNFQDDRELPETDDDEELFDSEEIEFSIPGESVVSAAAVIASSGEETEEVVFEAVDDDAEVDMLPGEHYSDGEEEDTVAGMGYAEAALTHDSDHYSLLEEYIIAYRETRSHDDLNSLQIEVNSLRGGASSDYTAKIYLQLLSSVCQISDRGFTGEGNGNFSCMDEILSGLQLTISDNASFEQGQEQLLCCTSMVMLLQNGEIQAAGGNKDHSAATVKIEPEQSEVDSEGLSADAEIEKMSSDESLKSFVQDELADIRKIFLDEISSLRKEFRD